MYALMDACITHESVTDAACTHSAYSCQKPYSCQSNSGMSNPARNTIREICHAGAMAPNQHNPSAIATSLPEAAPVLTASTNASSKPPSVVRSLCLLLNQLADPFLRRSCARFAHDLPRRRQEKASGLPLGDTTTLPIVPAQPQSI